MAAAWSFDQIEQLAHEQPLPPDTLTSSSCSSSSVPPAGFGAEAVVSIGLDKGLALADKELCWNGTLR